MPFAFVDLDLFDQNIKDILPRAGSKKIRIASKSVRCRFLLQRILDANKKCQGIMAFSPNEAVFLSENGFDDILIAYPFFGEEQLKSVAEAVKIGKLIIPMVDSEIHLQRINSIGKANGVVIPICFDIDMSSDYPGLRFGVYRSGITKPEQVASLIKVIDQLAFVRLDGIMGYEAQIAGLGDSVKGQGAKNAVVRMLKKRSIKELKMRRKTIVEQIGSTNLRFVNAGGTGSLESSREEDWVTEVTVGSGFYASGLFDHYQQFKHHPAAAYAIEICRQPRADIFTCLGGGYVASGAPGKDKIPYPYLPKGFELTANEGAGEVQTPIVYKGNEELKIGDPIFLRHSKAGELCERFNYLYLVSDGKIVEKVPTYRGEGQCFL